MPYCLPNGPGWRCRGAFALASRALWVEQGGCTLHCVYTVHCPLYTVHSFAQPACSKRYTPVLIGACCACLRPSTSRGPRASICCPHLLPTSVFVPVRRVVFRLARAYSGDSRPSCHSCHACHSCVAHVYASRSLLASTCTRTPFRQALKWSTPRRQHLRASAHTCKCIHVLPLCRVFSLANRDGPCVLLIQAQCAPEEREKQTPLHHVSSFLFLLAGISVPVVSLQPPPEPLPSIDIPFTASD